MSTGLAGAGDEHHAAKSVRALAGEQLRDLAAHAVPDQDVVEAEGGDHGRRVGGEIAVLMLLGRGPLFVITSGARLATMER